jgi:hypothetical protein
MTIAHAFARNHVSETSPVRIETIVDRLADAKKARQSATMAAVAKRLAADPVSANAAFTVDVG